MIEPNCDMPWEIYLDWLEDQGNEDLRFIDPSCLAMSVSVFMRNRFITYHYENRHGFGEVVDVMYNNTTLEPVLSYRGEGGSCMGGFGDGWGVIDPIGYGDGSVVNLSTMHVGDGEHD